MKHSWRKVIGTGITHVDWCHNCGTVRTMCPYDEISKPVYLIIHQAMASADEPRCRKVDAPELGGRRRRLSAPP